MQNLTWNKWWVVPMVVRATGNRPLDKVGGFIHVLFIDIKLKFMQKYNIEH